MTDDASPTTDRDDGGGRAPRSRVGRRAAIGGAVAAVGAAALSSRLGALGDRLDRAARSTERAVRINPPTPTAPGSYDPEALYVALYGFPGAPVLGALGDQGVEQSAVRIQGLADLYTGFGRRVVPTFEVLGSVASQFAGSDGDYSNEFPASVFQPYIDVAARNEFHVVIDLQTGNSSFPDQIREYEEVMRAPNVSVALDPEWRGDAPWRPGGGRIGTVDAPEVNATIDWLDDLIQTYALPPKMCIVHQFEPSMITNKQAIRGTANVQVVLQMDGWGNLTLKRSSWQRMVNDLPPDSFTGWKNFLGYDRPLPTPDQTMANAPTPRYVSYQ